MVLTLVVEADLTNAAEVAKLRRQKERERSLIRGIVPGHRRQHSSFRGGGGIG